MVSDDEICSCDQSAFDRSLTYDQMMEWKFLVNNNLAKYEWLDDLI